MAPKIGRPQKVRFIQQMPPVLQFSPRGKPGRPDIVTITLDEYEALKLADLQGFSQTQGATAMNVARSSFGRLLRSARKKLAEAIVQGKIIKIALGEAQVGVRRKEFTKEGLHDEIEKFKNRYRALTSQAMETAGAAAALNNGDGVG